MAANVGLSTPRGSGTSGYVQRNFALLKPRDSGYGSTPQSSYGPPGSEGKDSFRQRQPDKQILEHDRRRAIELQVLEERDRLEEENERIDEEEGAKGVDVKVEDDEKTNKAKREKLSEEEVEERLDALRARLTKELEDELAGKPPIPTGPRHMGKRKHGDEREWDRDRERDAGAKGRKQFKSYQVHELAEAKIEESERLRRALGIKKEGEDDERERYRGERRRDEREPRRRRSSNDRGEERKYRDWDDPRERDRDRERERDRESRDDYRRRY
jgi:hypothetical protein